jgi:Uma2 family endonuclease
MVALRSSREYWTVDDLDALPRGPRYELHDGILEFKQPLTGWHRHVQYKLLGVLLDTGLYADFEVGMINAPGDTRVADVAVLHGRPRDQDAALAHYPPERFRVVVEVLSRGSAKKDRDPQWYADRRIPEYWLVEPVGDDVWDALVTMHELVVDADRPGYRETGRTTLNELVTKGYHGRP